MFVLALVDQLNDLAEEFGDLPVVALDADEKKEWEDNELWRVDGAQYHEGETKLIVIV